MLFDYSLFFTNKKEDSDIMTPEIPEEDLAELTEQKIKEQLLREKNRRRNERDLENLRKEVEEKELRRRLNELEEEEERAAKEARRAKIDKLKNAARATGRGVAKGAGLMGGLAVKPIRGAYKGYKNTKNLTILFWIAVLIQIIDVFILRFNRTVYFATSIAMYGILTLLAIWAFSREEGHLATPRQIILFILISFFYVVVPTLLYAIPQIRVVGNTTLFDWTSFLLAILPIWPIYIGLKADIPFVHKYINFWILFLLFTFLFGVGFKLSSAHLPLIGGRPEVIQVGTVANFLWEQTTESVKNFWDALNPSRFVNVLVNASGMNYYIAQIERTEEAPVGLYIDNVRLRDRYTYEGEPAVIWADIRGKSFMDEIRVTPTCYIDKVGEGIANPPFFSILGEEHVFFSCTFNDLKKGTYTAHVGANFNFETWAYVTYTFVDIETKRAFELQGKNINHELDIPLKPLAVSTPGPVVLGMGGLVDQPVALDLVYNTRRPVLGVTLDNYWNGAGNRIESVDEFVIMVPDDFELVDCDRGTPEVEKGAEEGYDFYKFKREQLGDPRLGFQSVTCFLHVKNPKQLLGGAQKVQRTFVAKVKYRYNLEKRVSINVRE